MESVDHRHPEAEQGDGAADVHGFDGVKVIEVIKVILWWAMVPPTFMGSMWWAGTPCSRRNRHYPLSS